MREGADNQFLLLGQRRFGPFFFTQFLGAFNDNVYRNALLLLIAFHAADRLAADTNTLINLSTGLFVLPFFLFSALGGQLADRYEKSLLMRRIKLLEIAIMTLAAVALWFDAVAALIALLFAMGLQSSLFGPVKYGVLPQLVGERELMGANGLVETGTFLAILLGAALGGVLISVDDGGPLLVAGVVVLTAVSGYLSARLIPPIPAVAPGERIDWNILAVTWRLLTYLARDRSLLIPVIGISWFWLLGSLYLAQLPNFTRLSLGGDEIVVTLLLSLFSIGVGAGSLLCEKFSGGRVDLGLVPLGALGLTLFGLDLALGGRPVVGGELLGAAAWLAGPESLRVVADILFLGMSGGLYIVPLYTAVQHRAEPAHRSRVIAANNVLNALFMVLGAVAAIVILGGGASIEALFLAVTLAHAALALALVALAPGMWRSCLAMLGRSG